MTTESTPTETLESEVSNTIDEAASEGERMLARVWKPIAANGVRPSWSASCSSWGGSDQALRGSRMAATPCTLSWLLP